MNKNNVAFLWASVLWLAMSSASAVDWQAVSGQKIVLFYPGQTDWEWLLTEHEGADKIKAGQACRHCHNDMQAEMGQKLVGGTTLDSTPLIGKPGSIEVVIKAAHDKHNLYLQMSWPGAVQTDGKNYPDYQAMASVMFDDGAVPEISRGGCWGTCHADVNSMSSADSGKDISKYLVKSRSKMSRRGGGDHIKPEAELHDLLAAGRFGEVWQARLNSGQAPVVSSAYILEKRHEHDPVQVTANAQFNNGIWFVEFSRPLVLNRSGFKEISPTKTYTFNFAVHDGYVRGRRHYVSLAYTLRLDDGPADFIAREQ